MGSRGGGKGVGGRGRGRGRYTDKKENKIFLMYKEMQLGSGAHCTVIYVEGHPNV